MIVPASYVSKAHTILASAAFLSALIIGLRLHYFKIVKNEVAGYPDEWWPSVSATIGDWYPERSVFQILIALTAGPRFALIFCWWLLTRSTTSMLPTAVSICGVIRTISCGGWVYITSSDDHNAHDVLMISYMVLNLPWMIGSIIYTPAPNALTCRRRKLVASLFFFTIAPMVYFFVQHKVHKIPGAYTKYSFCEWFLIFTDVWFDSITTSDFAVLKISISHPSTETVSSVKHGREHLRYRSSVIKDIQSSSLKSPPPQSSHADVRTQGSSDMIRQHMSVMKAFRVRLGTPHSLQQIGSFLADVYLVYMWWSIFTALSQTLFYFSVWELSLSGQEIALFSTLSPILLGVASVRTSLRTRNGQTWLQILSVLGLLAYKIEDPLLRLFAVTFANVSGSLLRAIEWSNPQEAERHGIILALGLVVSSLSKLLNHSVNPIWPIVDSQSGGWNKLGIFLAVLAVQDYAMRDLPVKTTQSQKAGTISSERLIDSSSNVTRHTSLFEHWSLASLGLGGLIFSLHCLLTDSGTLIAYSWTGYPVTGPLPGLHGYLTLMAMGVGVLISNSNVKHIVYHPIWMVFGASSTYLMYQWRDWLGYLASLCLSVFLSSLIPATIGLASLHGTHAPGKMYFTAWLVVCLLDFASVWTVAYAFVPAGWLLRERTDMILAIQMGLLGLGLIPAWQRSSLAIPCTPPAIIESTFRLYVKRLLAVLVSVSFLATTALFPTAAPRPHRADQRLITAGIWTVHFGIDDAGRESQYRMRDLIKDMELDIVGLLESDLQRIVFGNRDLTRVISEDLGYYVDIGPGPNSHTWGAALLSKFPILSSTHHLLPSPHGELAPAISAVLDIWGQNVTVVVSHNGQEEDPLDRELQSSELARIMAAAYPDPTIFLGYVVSKPLATRPDPYEILVTDGRMHDIDDEDWDRWCEYILYRGLYRVAYARVSRSTITDTELQIGKFVLPKFDHPVIDAPREERYLRTYREDLPSSMWFPDEYLDKVNPGGKRGHFYHVHPWPLYHRLPDNAVV